LLLFVRLEPGLLQAAAAAAASRFCHNNFFKIKTIVAKFKFRKLAIF
jgi:hypothetical protein